MINRRQNTNSKKFVDRVEELKLLQAYEEESGLLIVMGRRRVGKTLLLKKWIEKNKGLFSQSIESSSDVQIAQTVDDFKTKIDLPAEPKSWLEFFRLIDSFKRKFVICIDEFQYLVKSDPSLPSILQKWLDHENKSKSLIVLAGSSSKLMKEACLDSDSPLFGRAKQVINLAPISYPYFAKYLNLDPKSSATFEVYSLVGGIPKYWEFVKIIQKIKNLKTLNGLNVIEDLYFTSSPFMEGEIGRVLSDEKIEGLSPISVLETIGRGATRPSEIASRMGTPQTQLSKVFDQLITAKIITKDVPFKSSERGNKFVYLAIKEPSTLSWYSLASVHRSRWSSYSDNKKSEIFNTYCGIVYEEFVRGSILGAQRYWNSEVEIDFIYSKSNIIYICEVKWKMLTEKESKTIFLEMKEKVKKIGFLSGEEKIVLEIYDRKFLKTGSRSFKM